MSGFKSLEDVLTPDARMLSFAIIDASTRPPRPLELEDHYQEIAEITISNNAPASVIREFDKARNFLLYSWFVYEFGMTAIARERS